jgi:hypothetical protein
VIVKVITPILVAAACCLCSCSTPLVEKTEILDNRRVSGYRGIWFTLGQFSEYGDKYSGGLGTYTAKHRPLAIYAPEVDRTFFVYGGTTRKKEKRLLCMIGYYDHQNHSVPQPTVVVDKVEVIDPHDDPSLAIDGDGYLWVFVSGRAKKRPGFKYRSDFPYSIDSFTRITEEEMTYPQPLWKESKGFFHFFTKYTGVRELYFETSSDGFDWSNDTKLAGIIEPGATKSGHYQVSGQHGDIVCTFFNRHPDGVVDKRTDLYYAQSSDWGRTWTTVEGKPLELPMTTVDCGARLIDYQSMGKNVYLKDLNFDENGYPVCLYVTSDGHEPGPKNGSRVWTVTRYDGSEWKTSRVCESDHNYDMGSLYIDGSEWVVIGPTDPGPQVHQAGGELVRWVSRDSGETWIRKRGITQGSRRNHNYARRPEDARNPFFSFWADGDPTTFSESRLYFCNGDGTEVFQMPYHMRSVSEPPIPVNR